ncbi:MAG TPA: hypothetical protein VMQ51_11705 [Candidatus Binatia bacterium]|nr:hypothetical protein [Candidatus Binatia bacterium]
MKTRLAVVLAGILIGGLPALGLAQPGMGITTTTPTPAPVAPHEGVHPGDADFHVTGPPVEHRPMFIGPTSKTETTELGLSAWIAPQPPIGTAQTGWRDSSGWAALGVTFTWGGPPRRAPAAPPRRAQAAAPRPAGPPTP